MPQIEGFMTIAHRGASVAAPENTLAAVRKAIEIGVEGVEFDIHRTQDSRLILMHDATVDRTTNGTGRICDLPFDRIKALDAGVHKGAAFAGERVPLLRNALGVLKGKAMPVIEIKDEGISKQTLDEVQERGMIAETAIICFNAKTIREVGEIAPNIRKALLIGEKAGQSPGDLVALTRESRADHPDLYWKLATPECVAAFHAEGMPVWVWTVNDEETTGRLMDIGVDGITTDDPARLKEVVRRRGMETKKT